MSMGSWVKAFWKLSALKKMPWWKGILLSLWKVRVLRRFLDKMQQVSAGSWVIAFYSISVKSAGCQKLPEYYAIKMINDTSIYHCGMCGLSEDSLLKCKQMSMGSWVKAFCSISVESAGSQKIPS